MGHNQSPSEPPLHPLCSVFSLHVAFCIAPAHAATRAAAQVVSVRELAGLGVSAILDLRQPPVGCKLEQDNLWGALR